MKAILTILVLILLVGFCSSVWNRSQQEANAPKAAEAPHKSVNADVRFNALTIGIKNLDETNWPDLNVFINGLPLFGYGCGLRALKPGEATTIPLTEFTKDKTGERFDPYHFKVVKVWIGGNGFDYSAFGSN